MWRGEKPNQVNIMRKYFSPQQFLIHIVLIPVSFTYTTHTHFLSCSGMSDGSISCGPLNTFKLTLKKIFSPLYTGPRTFQDHAEICKTKLLSWFILVVGCPINKNCNSKFVLGWTHVKWRLPVSALLKKSFYVLMKIKKCPYQFQPLLIDKLWYSFRNHSKMW